MTINCQLATVADSISKLSISGVTIKDIDTIPENAIDYCPVLFPVPDNFITDVQFTRQSYGADSVAAMDVSYTMNWRYLHAPIGSGSVLQNYTGIITKLELIIEAILGNSSPTGAVNMTLLNVSDLGPVSDVAGQTMYHGVDIALRVEEFAQ